MKQDLETIYESMLTPSILGVIRQALPLSPVKAFEGKREDEEETEEETEEEDEKECDNDVAETHVEIAREILSIVSDLDDLAKEAMYKSFRKKIERCADKIRDLANEIIEDHGYDV
jgi:phage-related tail protein